MIASCVWSSLDAGRAASLCAGELPNAKSSRIGASRDRITKPMPEADRGGNRDTRLPHDAIDRRIDP